LINCTRRRRRRRRAPLSAPALPITFWSSDIAAQPMALSPPAGVGNSLIALRDVDALTGRNLPARQPLSRRQASAAAEPTLAVED